MSAYVSTAALEFAKIKLSCSRRVRNRWSAIGAMPCVSTLSPGSVFDRPRGSSPGGLVFGRPSVR
jgi:hypothetical protein